MRKVTMITLLVIAVMLIIQIVSAQGYDVLKNYKIGDAGIQQTLLKLGSSSSSTKVDRVTIYPDRALVERVGSISIPPGESTISVEFLPQHIDQNSIRVTVKGDVAVTLGGTEVFYERWKPEVIQELGDSIQTINDRLSELQIEEDGLATRKRFLESIAGLGGASPKEQNLVISPQNLVTTAEFLETQLQDIAKAKTDIAKERRELTKKKKEFQEMLNNISGGGAGRGYRVDIPVVSRNAGRLTFTVKYVVYNAGWYPTYDARYDESTGKVDLTYFGTITQSTGENWDDAKIVLSSAQPQMGTEPPTLYQWYLRKYEPPVYDRAESKRVAPAAPMMTFAKEAEAPAGGDADDYVGTYEQSVALMSGETVIFEIKARKVIPADGQKHRVVVAEITMDADKKFLTIPKLDARVYLTAKCKNESDYLLIPGKISVFQGNDFIGTQNLDESIGFNEEIELAMGPVQTIKVERKQVKEFTEKTGIIGQNKREFFAFDIIISNNSKSEATIEVIDQIPVSTHEDIKIEDVKYIPEPDKKDKDFKGQLIWKVSVKPGEKKTVKSQFAVKYPKNMIVEGL